MKLLTTYLLLLGLTSSFSYGQVINLRGSWKFHIGDRESWSKQDFDDRDWEYIVAPSAWEDEGFNGYDGFAWYRKKFDGRRLSSNENYYINLGYIDDCDEVYINGLLIGFSGYMPPKFKTAYNTERKYNIPSSIINFNGENTIAIRVFDVTQGGGIIEGDIGIYRAERSRLLVDLQGLWDFALSSWGESIKNSSQWEKIMVPAPWEHQGFSKYDGFAWYRKTFIADKSLTNRDEDYVILMGKIDDFDKVYVNGRLIGSTNDQRHFGASQSYARFRAYSIPPDLIKLGTNTVEVLVEDIGNIGGIYEGPVGIATRTIFERYYR
ncbi:MAG: hypothetical protein KDC99_08175 [Cyclobacteriaceae bacterium]|nr:hypothetical protein [Cyclobacteriaceae bacterium]